MKKIALLIVSVFMLMGCTANKYSQTEQPLKVEVNTNKEDVDKSIKNDLLKNDKGLDDVEKEAVQLEYDDKALKIINEFEVLVKSKDKELLIYKVKIQDTTKPIIKLDGTEFEVGTDIKDKIQFTDNFDEAEVLKENLNIEGYDLEKVGEQEITVTLKDSNGNEASEKFEIVLIEAPTVEETPASEQTYDWNDVPYSGGGSSGGNSGGSGNSGSSGGGNSSPAPAPTPSPSPAPAPEPVSPPALCPGGNNEDMPCDFTPNVIGNGGIFNSFNEAEEAMRKLGYTVQDISIGTVNYNDGTVKFTFRY